ncbi:MAG: Xaa-Pro peptidase family protein [Halobacteriales archaeon]|nr:Xaa-Pro peptidase family protein [Halobacteriales archaeon]
MNRYEGVDAILDDSYDAYLHVGDEDDENLYYLSDFDAPDPFTLLRTDDGRTVLLVSTLEHGRAQKESNADGVRNTNEFFDGDRRGDPEARVDALGAFLDEYDAREIAVPRDFSLYTADELRERGYVVETVADPVAETRAVKDEDEIDKIRRVQRANEEAMRRAQTLLEEAETETRDGEDVLAHDGEVLTAERVKTEIEVALVRERCSLDTTIVACGERGADPHWRGEGPLRPDEPIIIDIFPRGASKYFADMTRTFVVGEPSERVREMYELSLEAQEAAFDVLSCGADAGITGEDVHDAVCDVYEEAGYGTVRAGDETGFIHSTGHGVGLEIHENPRLSAGGDELRAGNVVTVEPGLYLPEVGGVRVEDFVVVRDDGYENLTDYPKDLTV